MNWPAGFPFPSKEQSVYIEDIVHERRERFSSVLGRQVHVIPYSSTRGYELETLFRTLIDVCGHGLGWLFHGLKNFSYRDFLPPGFPDQFTNPAPRAKDSGLGIKDYLQKAFGK